ncbi:MAG: hypothetical protein KKE17_13600 [Proteobacteria bacterium]|nr:hypothetical protein [Pseudomonadota bacterium]MBU1711032.1 hypothetical protein [Pseudomonadota bacterium]
MLRTQHFLPSLVVSLLFVFCAMDVAQAAAPQEYMIFYSNNVQGETEPCG